MKEWIPMILSTFLVVIGLGVAMASCFIEDKKDSRKEETKRMEMEIDSMKMENIEEFLNKNGYSIKIERVD